MATDMSYLSLETLTTFDLGGLTMSAGQPVIATNFARKGLPLPLTHPLPGVGGSF